MGLRIVIVGVPGVGKSTVVAEAKEAIPVLVEALRDKEAEVRDSAAEALGALGADAREAVTALLDLIKDKDEDVRQTAVEALKKIDPKRVPKDGD